MLVPALCPLCEEHRDCHACTQVPAKPQRGGLKIKAVESGDWERGRTLWSWHGHPRGPLGAVGGDRWDCCP